MPLLKRLSKSGNGCGRVGRVVASYTRDLQFELNYIQFYFPSTVLNKLCSKNENKEKNRPRMAYF